MSIISNDKLAVLIDADNAQAAIAKELLDEIARYGTASVKRAYGDWTTPNLKSWKEVLHKLAIQPIQQFAYTTGKNGTDSAMIIDAMDLLYSGKFDGFCIVASDSDYTRLATRVREAGLLVYGLGEQKTPEPFVAACDKFIYTEILRPTQPASAPVQSSVTPSVSQSSQPSAKPPEPTLPPLEPMLREAITATVRDDGWAVLSTVGWHILKTNPAFDPRNYKFPKLSELVRKQDYLETKDEPTSEGSAHVRLCVRLKNGEK